MIENLDIILDGVIELIRSREIDKARERFLVAKKTVLSADFSTRKKMVQGIVISIYRLNKTKQSLDAAIDSLPEEYRFHAREGFREVMEDINLQLNLLRNQKKNLSRS